MPQRSFIILRLVIVLSLALVGGACQTTSERLDSYRRSDKASAVEQVEPYLKSSYSMTRLSAVHTLEDMQRFPRAGELLLAASHDRDALVRGATGAVLFRSTNTVLHTRAVELMADDSPQVRRMVAGAIFNVATVSTSRWVRVQWEGKSSYQSQRVTWKHPDAALRAECEQYLFHLTRDADPDVRGEAACGLVCCGFDDGLREALRMMKADPVPAVRHRLAREFGSLREELRLAQQTPVPQPTFEAVLAELLKHATNDWLTLSIPASCDWRRHPVVVSEPQARQVEDALLEVLQTDDGIYVLDCVDQPILFLPFTTRKQLHLDVAVAAAEALACCPSNCEQLEAQLVEFSKADNPRVRKAAEAGIRSLHERAKWQIGR